MKPFLKIVAILMMLSFFASFAHAQTKTPYLVFDYKSGVIYAEQKPFDRWYPASLVKLMTAYTVFKEVERGTISLKSPVRVSQHALSQPPSKMGFPVGTRLNFDNALKIIMVKSSNDVSVAIAESAAGTEARFVALMNKYAQELGMVNSNFVNPNGLHDDNQYTSARDMGVLAKAIITQFPQYKDYFNIPAIKVGRRTMRNHNKLMQKLDGTNGMKTGYTCPSGLNVLVSRKHNQKHLIAVVMGMPSGRTRNALAAKLLTNAENVNGNIALGSFENFKPKQTVAEPINLRPVVCVKKKKVRAPKVEYMMFYPLQNESLAQREARYYTEEKPLDTVVQVNLGNSDGPDPFALNRDPVSPETLVAPLLSNSDYSIPDQPKNYLASIRDVEDVMVLSNGKFDLAKVAVPVPEQNPEREERLARARHKNILPQLSNPDASAPQQPEHFLQTIWDADWAPVQFRPIYKLPDGSVVSIPVSKSSIING